MFPISKKWYSTLEPIITIVHFDCLSCSLNSIRRRRRKIVRFLLIFSSCFAVVCAKPHTQMKFTQKECFFRISNIPNNFKKIMCGSCVQLSWPKPKTKDPIWNVWCKNKRNFEWNSIAIHCVVCFSFAFLFLSLAPFLSSSLGFCYCFVFFLFYDSLDASVRMHASITYEQCECVCCVHCAWLTFF